MDFDYSKEYVATYLLDMFELPLYVRKSTWPNDHYFKILSAGEWLCGETYKGGKLDTKNQKYKKTDVFFVCEVQMPKFKNSENKYIIDDEQVKAEEQTTLDKKEEKICNLYNENQTKYLDYKKEIENFVIYDWEDRNRLLDIRELAEMYKQAAEEYLSFMPCPYFMRVDVAVNNQETKSYFLGEKELTEGTDIIVYDWRNPIVAGARFTSQKNFETDNGRKKNYCELYLRRSIYIKNKKVDVTETEFDSGMVLLGGNIIDKFLLSVLRDKRRDYKLTDIIKTIQSNQNEIISKPINESFIVQGCAGSGKTMVLLHRLSYLLYNYKNYDVKKYCILTPNEFFNLHIDDLSKDLGIDQIPRFTVEQYYVELIKRLTAEDFDSKIVGGKISKASKIKLPTGALISEKLLNEQFLSDIYSDEFQTDMMMLYNSVWDEFKEKITAKEFSRLTLMAEKKIPEISEYNFETYRRLKLYHAGLVATVEKTEEDLENAQKKCDQASSVLANVQKQVDEANAILPLLTFDIETKINNALTSYENEIETLRIATSDISGTIIELENKKSSLLAELGNTLTARESEMSDAELIALEYVENTETFFTKYIKEFCQQDISEIKQLQLDIKKIPFYNFGKRGTLNKKIGENTQQYKIKALRLLDEFRSTLQNNIVSLQSDLKQIKADIAENLKKREEIEIKQEQNISLAAKIRNTKLILSEEKRAALIEPLLKEAFLDFLKGDLRKLLTAVKTIESSQNIVLSQNKIMEENKRIIDECQMRNIDKVFKQELSEFIDSIEIIDMKNIYSVLEKKLKDTYRKYGQTYKINDKYRHKLYVLLMICSFYYGNPRNVEQFINIDEAQDIAASEYRVLMNVLGQDCVWNLYGDVNQLVYSYKGIIDWEQLDNRISSNLCYLNENYRNTVQITEYCNDEFGADVTAIGLNGEKVALLSLKDAVAELQDQHSSNVKSRCAIIYKKGNEQIAMEAAEMLSEKDRAFDAVDNDRISIITVEMSKGLEFENVVAINDSMTINEKYVSYTRALEKLIVTQTI